MAPGMGFEPMLSRGEPVFKTGAVSWLGYPGPKRSSHTSVNLYRLIKDLPPGLGQHKGEKPIEQPANIGGKSKMKNTFESIYLKDVLHRFKQLKSLAERAIAQVSDGELFTKIDEESNSIAILMKHLAGNMLYNWTDPFKPYDEKPKRHRDEEFEVGSGDAKAEIFARWEEGWECLFNAMEQLKNEDLNRSIEIRWREYSLIEAINRQLVHYAQHVGQMIFIAKHFRRGDWQSLSIPRGQSEAFNEMMRERYQGKPK